MTAFLAIKIVSLFIVHQRAADLLRLLGGERSWSESEIQIDLNVLELNRLRTVRDLRSLSEKSWEVCVFIERKREGEGKRERDAS